MKRIVLLAWLALLPLAALAEDPAGLDQLRKSAESGDAEAMLELGILYEFGYRMQDHNAPALAWYRMAADAGNPKAGARHDALKGKIGAKEIEEANKLYAEYTLTVKKSMSVAPAASTTPISAPTPPAGEATKETSTPETGK